MKAIYNATEAEEMNYRAIVYMNNCATNTNLQDEISN